MNNKKTWDIREENDKQYHIKPDGSLAYKQQFDIVWPFSEGLAKVKLDGKYFHIKPDGSPAYEQRFDWVDNFKNGSTAAELNDKWFNIKSDGSRVD